ncbi:methylthioribose-1-phosphate isomerase-like [Paramacrobiotus metropolitanus]|uniref:methylthioribose-1-phosphate isomerase-like n=1 Tax=Paramacrobiotus metropolitanus TaxID=2943436 RepID=UPI00244586EA|nr:methylthioribose-1-phosphate isomerase-like [Paramacrobiotus metropolitanus]
MTLEAIRYTFKSPRPAAAITDGDVEMHRGAQRQLSILNQLLLPSVTEYLPIRSVQNAFEAIRSMQVRGAPAIAIVGCLSLAVELDGNDFPTMGRLLEHVVRSLQHLVESRPTAVNMRTAADHVGGMAQGLFDAFAKENEQRNYGEEEVARRVHEAKERLIAEMEGMLAKDIADNVAMGDWGARDMLARCPGKQRLNILTHCNTGSLATAGYGTALGVVRSLQKMNKLEHVFFNETRPYCQGSRLTAYELVTERIPSTLICDSASGWLMATGKVDCVVTGADRVAANGDTANKIGTYMLAVLAAHHRLPFYIAAPITTCDLTIPSGREIVIEERDAAEITSIRGQPISPAGVTCWNPAFDVTPAALITGGIITEKGVFRPEELRAAISQSGDEPSTFK